MPLKLILIGFWAAFCGKSRQNPFLLHIHTPVLSIFFHATSFIWRHGLPKLVIAKIQVPIWGFWGYAKSHGGHIATVFDAHIPPPKGLFPISRVNPDFKKNGISRFANPFVLLAISIEPPHRPLSNTAGLSAGQHHKGF